MSINHENRIRALEHEVAGLKAELADLRAGLKPALPPSEEAMNGAIKFAKRGPGRPRKNAQPEGADSA